MIMLVRDDEDRALLGRQDRWAPGWYSTLAGFVEPGESPSEAVAREVAEEVGLRVGRVSYLAGQPWPFPCSLMLGHHAWTEDREITVDGAEIREARWFTRDELARACESARVRLPPRLSISRFLIESWHGGRLPASWSGK